MIGLFGTSVLTIALGLASFAALAAALGGLRGVPRAVDMARRAAWLHALLVVAANVAMVVALVRHDFSVSYVAEVGSRSTPLFFTVVSLWASLRGSLLFWAAILAVYAALFAWQYRDRFPDMSPYGLATLMVIALFFDFLVTGVDNPFAGVHPVPADGPGPNPLLQNHPLMAFHPPMLYLGYVGMAVPYAMVTAALFRGRLDLAWIKALRNWVLLPWMCLTIGIVAGGWWSYEVLGWGGYWAWDPVENASFLPWLTATAFLHTALLHERRRILKAWTITLAMVTFLLTVLGTFMTRSGVFNSVHAFTQGAIGPIFLGFLAVALVFSVVLLAARIDRLVAEETMGTWASRESAFLVNNVLFMAFTLTVLLGTVFPLLVEAISGRRISVGEPYFDKMAVPLGIGIVFLMGVGPALPWGRATVDDLRRRLLPPAAAALAAVSLLFLAGLRDVLPLLSFGVCAFAAWVTLVELLGPVLARRRRGDSWRRAAGALWRRGRRRFGGYLVHLGIIVCVVAITASSAYKESAATTLKPGESFGFRGYTLVFNRASTREEPHRFVVAADVDVYREGRKVAQLEPRLNYFNRMREPIGTPAVRTFSREDLYLTLMNVDPGGAHVSLQVQIHPLVAWIWWSVPLIALGCIVAMIPDRRRPSGSH